MELPLKMHAFRHFCRIYDNIQQKVCNSDRKDVTLNNINSINQGTIDAKKQIKTLSIHAIKPSFPLLQKLFTTLPPRFNINQWHAS